MPAISLATLLIALRGIILPFWHCSSLADVFERAMTLSELEFLGVVFGIVLATLSAQDLARRAARALRRRRRKVATLPPPSPRT